MYCRFLRTCFKHAKLGKARERSNSHRSHINTSRHGFSLIEMSVVILIVGLIAGAGFSILTSTMGRNDYSNTKARITEIKRAITRYYTANNRLPCPADLTAKYGDTNYGTETFAGACSTNAPAASETFRAVVASNNIRQGAVPTRALALQDEMMYDEYSMKFTYAVMESFTVDPIPTSNGVITIGDGVTATPIVDGATNGAVYVIISHGNDRIGAYTTGGTPSTACTAKVNSENDIANCDTPFDGIFASAQFNDLNRDNTNWFDDILGWAMKSEFSCTGVAEFNVCPAVGATCTDTNGELVTCRPTGTAEAACPAVGATAIDPADGSNLECQ
jgi:prepilin-type N-terminal cleavage/methylation domain-containing protein